MDFSRKKLRIGDVLIAAGVLTKEKLEEALEKQKGTGHRIGEVLIDEGYVNEEQVAHALSEQLNIELIDLNNVSVDNEILTLIPPDVLKKNKVMPFEYSPDNLNTIRVAVADPLDMNAIDDISIITNRQVEVFVATPSSIRQAHNRFYGNQGMNKELEAYVKEREGKLNMAEEAMEEDINTSPIVKQVTEMIEEAVLQRASDIHVEPMEHQLRIRYRIDGALVERGIYSIRLLPAISTRIKVIGGMDISEKRKPQDGRITQIVNRQEFDIRVSILPTVFGEKIVMRLTSKSGLTKDKSQLGLNPRDLQKFDRILKHPHGIILVTGPTGSGKSTTLYTSLSELNTEDVNISTVEDPVEANIDGLNQVHVNPKAGLTFASTLRSLLRQDPDIIMIGEIRDQETATIAVHAAITGHLVVSTPHAHSAASTVTRLLDMGIVDYLLADALVGIIAQRLVRRLCPECKRRRLATEEEMNMLAIKNKTPKMIYEPVGCPKCDNMGYKGRIGVYEIMEVTQKVKQVIAKGGNAEAIKRAALQEGMFTLRMSATELVLKGVTSVTEMRKVSFDS
ncbi:MAG: Flp pilus assembly complex ATPase component TadA [Lachnospiraceae bacterium]|nr:Flp pilus assembly complex ATPase component TadA [Lachnospiraceae bacterium]